MQKRVVFRAIRPPFLILTPACLFLGLSTAAATASPIDYAMFWVVLAGAVFAHIGVNALNEYYDFKSGLDFKTARTPFSGGSGALPGCPAMARSVRNVGWSSLTVTALIGGYLMMERGGQIWPIGVAGIVLAGTYTPWINRTPLLCLIAPGLGFGLLMVVGTHVVLAGEYARLPWLLSLVPFFLVNNLLLLNQYPDMEADSSVGRKTFPIVYGLRASSFVYAAFALAAYMLILVLIVQGSLPHLSGMALVPALLSLFAFTGAMRFSSKIGDSPIYLAANVAAAVLTPSLLGVSIYLG